jgi:hypothetical protein
VSPGDFLRAVWPSEGVYCIAVPFVIPGSDPPKTVYSHKTFDDVSAAVTHVLNKRTHTDVYFSIHTLKQHQVWNPEKENLKTGEMGSNEVRVQRNAKAARAFFFDLDVGTTVDKYLSQLEAGLGLRRFCEVTGLPKPLVVSSGGGLHVYWVVSEALDSEAWRIEAAKLRQLARHHGLKCDPSRTTDTSSVLRVPGTSNFKDRRNPRPVDALSTITEIGTGAFVKLIDKAMIEAGIEAKLPVKVQLDTAADILGSNTTREYDGPAVSLQALITSCAQMRRLALLARAKQPISEPEWYYGVIGVGRFLEDGHRRIMQFGDQAWHATIRDKIKQSEQHQKGPTSCSKLAEISAVGDNPCTDCPFAGKVHGPIGAARYTDPAPPPTVQQLVGTTQVTTTIPDAPKPFMRMKGGGVSVYSETADGEKAYTQIYEHDLYPIRRLANTQAETEQQVWHVSLPRGEEKDFTLDAEMLYDPRKFTAAISNQGIYPNKSHIPTLQEYMVAYIAQLQKLQAADAQCNHLGWTDECTQFILPDKILSADGKVVPAQLSVGAERASAQVFKKGRRPAPGRAAEFLQPP